MKSLLAALLLAVPAAAVEFDAADPVVQSELIAPPPSPKLCPEPKKGETDDSLASEAADFLTLRVKNALDRLEIPHKEDKIETAAGRRGDVVRFYTFAETESGQAVSVITQAKIVRKPYERRSRGCPPVRGCEVTIRIGDSTVKRAGEKIDWFTNGPISRLKRQGPVEIPTHCPSF